jgi:hypothetical protein
LGFVEVSACGGREENVSHVLFSSLLFSFEGRPGQARPQMMIDISKRSQPTTRTRHDDMGTHFQLPLWRGMAVVEMTRLMYTSAMMLHSGLNRPRVKMPSMKRWIASTVTSPSGTGLPLPSVCPEPKVCVCLVGQRALEGQAYVCTYD